MQKIRHGRRKFHEEKNEITIRFSAAEYLTYVAATGDSQENIEMRKL